MSSPTNESSDSNRACSEGVFHQVLVKQEPGDLESCEEEDVRKTVSYEKAIKKAKEISNEYVDNCSNTNDDEFKYEVSITPYQIVMNVGQPDSEKDDTLTCDDCGILLLDPLLLPSFNERLQCNKCINRTNKPALIKSDINTTCQYCNKTFRIKWRKFEHIRRVHTGDKPYKCDVCEKRFAMPNYLQVHQRSHDAVKPFICIICNYQFAQRSHLQAHERLHSGERPYSCDICNKTFSKKHHLSIHATVHSKEKPYACDICNKRFSQKSSVNVHKRRFVCVMRKK